MARIVCFGEILLRLASPPDSALLQERQLEASFCGAEANVGVALSGFGHRCAMVSALPGNMIGEAAKSELQSHGIETEAIATRAGRMGLYFLSPGAMERPSRITYDREGSAFARLTPSELDWPVLLKDADWLLVSGITPALGNGPDTALSDALRSARALGINIAFDSNFRPALWQGREAEAATRLREIANEANLLFAGRRAIGLMLGQSFDEPDASKGFSNAATAMFDAAPQLENIAATRRQILSSDHHELTALLAGREYVSASQTVDLRQIVDRVGTGDAFAAGILNGLIQNLQPDTIAEFALACSRWAHSIKGDFLRANEDDIIALMRGSSDVTR